MIQTDWVFESILLNYGMEADDSSAAEYLFSHYVTGTAASCFHIMRVYFGRNSSAYRIDMSGSRSVLKAGLSNPAMRKMIEFCSEIEVFGLIMNAF